MALKRNLKMYIKEKSTIIALVCVVVFAIASSLTFIDSLSYKKGISENFKNYEIDFIETNHSNVVYAVSGNHLFYSQDKEETSTLNEFAGIYDLSNEYGSPTSNLYNFIKIDYNFVSGIKDVISASDNQLGQYGETWVLTNDNYLYLISSRSKTVDLVHRNVSKFLVYQQSFASCSYLLLDDHNNLYKCKLDNNTFYKQFLLNKKIDSFAIVGDENKNESIIYKSNNNVYSIICDFDEENLSYSKEQRTSYDVVTCDVSDLININNLDFNYEKILSTNINTYIKENGKLYELILNNKNVSKELLLDENIDDFYTSGKALIIKISNKIYYIGKMSGFEYSDTLKELDIDSKNMSIYGSDNAVFLLDNKGRLFLYDKKAKQFNIMYERTITKYTIRYLSIFVVVMTLFYLIVAFLESNKRYNRYFFVNKNK